MFKLNLKIAWRNIWKNKLTTAIKLFGLIIGLSSVALLVTYITYELSYDKHNHNSDRIYRLHYLNVKEDKEEITLPGGMIEMMVQELPEVQTGAPLSSYKGSVTVGENTYMENILPTTHQYFEMFTTEMVAGSKKNALIAPNSAIVTESFARKAFPNQSAIGKQLGFSTSKESCLITGIIKDLPATSHVNGDVFIQARKAQPLNWRGYSAFPQYIMLKKGASVEALAQKLKKLYKKYEFPENVSVKLMPLTKIHLYSHTSNELEPNSDIKYIYIFSATALFILLIAIVNFINLTIASALKRAKEMGVKKVLGASKSQLRIQFLSETYIYFIVALLFVLIVIHDLIPFLGAKWGIVISTSHLSNGLTLIITLSIFIFVGFLAGFYPALVLSRLMPVKTLKGYAGKNSGHFDIRKILMGGQFSFSALLIICTIVIYSQLNFIRNKSLGFDKDQVIVAQYNIYGNRFKEFKQELLANKDVKLVSVSSFNPGIDFGGSSGWTNDDDTTQYNINNLYTDIDFVNTLKIKVLAGRTFSTAYASDLVADENDYKTQKLLLNEAAVKMLHLKNPVDTLVHYGGLQGRIIGVVNDFNGLSLHNKVQPLALWLRPEMNYGYLYIKVNSKDIAATMATINATWKTYFPNLTPDLKLLDVKLQQLYIAELRMGSIFIIFAAIAIFLCCVGLFAMVYFELGQRTKEMAVRKILGASSKELLALLNGSFLKSVLVANVLIWPLAYWFLKDWLNTFYYRIPMSFMPFLIALLLCIGLTILTVSVQAIFTIRKSPVDALKYE